jgi:hypothetical protein
VRVDIGVQVKYILVIPDFRGGIGLR